MVSRLLLAVILAAFAAASADAAPTARFTARKIQGSTCVAPCAVHFDAIGEGGNETTDPVFTRPFHSLLYQWDFGDPTSGTWANSGASKNTAVGAMAGHVYEIPGTYTVRLQVTNPAGEASSTSSTVTVADPNAVFSAANTFCFANTAGNWAGCPLNCAGGDDNCTVTSSWDQLTLQGDNCSGTGDCANADAGPRRILLRRGDRFTGGSQVVFSKSTTSPGLIAPFGSGAAPIIEAGGRNDWGSGWTVTGLNITRSTDAILLANDVDNATFYKIDARFSSSCIFEFNTGGSPRAGRQHAFVEVNCTASGPTGYASWPGGDYVLWMGGTFDKGGGSDSSLRSTHMQHYLLQHTRWTHAPPGREHWQFRAYDEFASTVTAAQEANRWVLISDNVVENPSSNGFFTVRVCVDSGCNCSEGAPQCGGTALGAGKIVNVADFIFERNFFKYLPDGTIGSRLGIFELQGGDFTIRNNVVDYQGALNSGDTSFIVATGQPREHTSGSTVSSNYHIDNNTVYFNQPFSARFNFTSTRGSLGSGCTGGCLTRNNLLVAPNFTGTLSDDSTFTRASNVVVRANPFVSTIPAQGTTIKENFRLGTSTAAASVVNSGYTFSLSTNRDGWVFDDTFGICRSAAATGSVDIGAHERDGSTCGGGSSPTALLAPTLLAP